MPFQVKGVLVTRGAGPGGSSLDGIVFIPVTTASKRLFNRDYLTTITVELQDPLNPDPVIEEITAVLRERHGIVPPGENDFGFVSPRAAAEQVADVDSTLTRVLTGVSVIATIIGGTVIMSLMLIAVSERRREIGVRRAMGATRQDILQQFLIEAAVASLIGGFIGSLLGVGGGAIAVIQTEHAAGSGLGNDRARCDSVYRCGDSIRAAAGLESGQHGPDRRTAFLIEWAFCSRNWFALHGARCCAIGSVQH